MPLAISEPDIPSIDWDAAEREFLERRMRKAATAPASPISVDPYDLFLAGKRLSAPSMGIPDVRPEDLSSHLFPFQRAAVAWALQKGRAALFEDTGLGKSRQEAEWGRVVSKHTSGLVLVLTPLAVAEPWVDEALSIGIWARTAQSQQDIDDDKTKTRIWVTNYEKLHLFDPSRFSGVVLDESSILKNFMGATKRALEQAFANTPYRLCATATPAPNDYLELGNHCAFLGIMPANEMIMRWFINDSMAAGSYRIKGHAEADYWCWVSSWAICATRPSDLSPEYSNDGYDLPPLTIKTHVVEAPADDIESVQGILLDAGKRLSATTMHKEMRRTAQIRAAKVAEIIAADDSREKWTVWCNTNYEADALLEMIPGAVDVRGSDHPDAKKARLAGFASGGTRILITKPSVAGFGLNWQHCARVAFVGLSYSYEEFYQALRRSWRFGQKREVIAHVVHADTEGDVLTTLRRKQDDHQAMQHKMADAMRQSGMGLSQASRGLITSLPSLRESGRNFEIRLGDSVKLIRDIRSNSVGLGVFSPPFEGLYIYSNHEADLGNCASSVEFFAHFRFLIDELYRVTIPGRLCCVHCKDLPLYKGRDGAAGLKDFPGEIRAAFEAAGWVYHSRVTIWKCPVIEMQRTKNHGLLYKNLIADSSGSRQGMADYVLTFRKWGGVADGESWPDPVTHDRADFPLSQWQKWASPVWMDISQTRVLNYQIAKGDKDEKHICPLQLDVIERCIGLWSNPGDLVLSPFAGIGSEGYQALLMGRRFAGFELKPEYFEIAAANLKRAEIEASQTTIFDVLDIEDRVAAEQEVANV